ncbi:SLC13 family permease [Natrinema sp. SYSU A 869]|uniref:GntP family permease n=1 Tax=Natrinema sp. SYSU A 869 TaxID=2871694 RepID=UPI001CA3CA2F|nr:SLC13 family permease [Natrinema sp. SYSU A 869]
MVATAPLIAFGIGLVSVILFLVVWDVPAFVGLILSALLVGTTNAFLLTDVGIGGIPEAVATAFGNNMAGVGIPILMAAVIGKSMTDSGAANRIVRSFQSFVSDDNADLSLWVSSSILSIPVFFDNVFYLMAPLARAMRARIGKNYALYIVVVGGGGVAMHAFVPPTPGPLAVAQELDPERSILGTTIIIGLAVALPAALISGILFGRFINQYVDIPLRDTMGTTVEDLEEQASKPASNLPSFTESILPVIVAVSLIAASTVVNTFVDVYPALESVQPATDYVGNVNFSLTLAAVIASLTYLRMDDFPRSVWEDEITDALRNGGNIAAITAAGGAFGAMLAEAGIGEVVASTLDGIGIGLLVTAWLIAAILRVAQGSVTVAMLTTGGIMAPQVPELTVHPAYLVMAIGSGAVICSWFNDSGFWIVKEIGGLTKAETLKTWTALTIVLSFSSLGLLLVYSTAFPLV